MYTFGPSSFKNYNYIELILKRIHYKIGYINEHKFYWFIVYNKNKSSVKTINFLLNNTCPSI